jgi:hypothetical protein
MFREVEMQVSLVTVSCPSLRTVDPPPCLPLDIKDSLKEDMRFFNAGFLMGDFDWLLLLLAAVSPPEQLSALRTLYTGFRKAKLKKS